MLLVIFFNAAGKLKTLYVNIGELCLLTVCQD